MQSTLYICKPLTPSKNEEEAPFLGETAKHHYQQEVGHDAFTQHPAVRSQEEILQHGRDKLAGNLKYVLVKQLSRLNISRYTSLSNSNSFSNTDCNILHSMYSAVLQIPYALQSTNMRSRKFIANKEESRQDIKSVTQSPILYLI